jgi:4-hydroxy-tetrahydrodipicolinate synthase
LAFLAQGGDGCISAASNIAPGLCRNMYLACRHGQIDNARRWAVPIAKLTAELFRETNPVPLKFALNLLGLMSPEVRLPLVQMSEPNRAALAAVIVQICNRYPKHIVGKFCGSFPEDVAKQRRAG